MLLLQLLPGVLAKMLLTEESMKNVAWIVILMGHVLKRPRQNLVVAMAMPLLHTPPLIFRYGNRKEILDMLKCIIHSW